MSRGVPREFRRAAEALFPASPAGKTTTAEAAAFAAVLGIGTDFNKYLNATEAEQKKFLTSFKNNLDLLIQKTWVEKVDEDRKDKLKNTVPALIAHIEQADYRKALEEFAQILEELAWLLFGPQSRKDDFFEYAFRIDTQMGLFWWYAGHLGSFLSQGGADLDGGVLKAVLLLGICFLTDF
ncbi:MAG: hypothetical protein LBN92_00655 [Treponema sp.]|nr:hypothetical protein [Treponema sp.]